MTKEEMEEEQEAEEEEVLVHNFKTKIGATRPFCSNPIDY